MLRIRADLETTFESALARRSDWVDLNVLSDNWLTSRLASGGPTSVHRAAAHLALAVFALETAEPAVAAALADQLARSYLDLYGILARAPWRTASTPEDQAEAARCNMLCALWQAHLGHWAQAARLMTTGLLDSSKDHVPEPVLRATAHLHAALLERQHKTGGAVSHLENEIDSLLRQFKNLDSRDQPSGLLFDARIPGHVLARSFAARLGISFDTNS